MRGRAIVLIGLSLVFFSFTGGCGSRTPDNYEFTVSGAPDSDCHWSVVCSEDGIVSYDSYYTEDSSSADGGADAKETFTFKGLRKGTVDVTLRQVSVSDKDAEPEDAYVITLIVDRHLNVSESDPYYGSYTTSFVPSGGAGTEWEIGFSDDSIVHWYAHREYGHSSPPGGEDYTMYYTFTGRRPGTTEVTVYMIPALSVDGKKSVAGSFTLSVDENYVVRCVG